MKKMIVALLGLGMMQAQAQTTQPLVIKAGEAKELALAENMNVVLLSASAADTAFAMDKASRQKLKVEFTGDKLQIEPRQSLSKKEPVYIIVNTLDKLTVGYNTKVRTSGMLQANHLQVYLDGLASAHLHTTGKVKAYPLGDFDIKVVNVENKDNLIAKKSR